MAKAKTTKRKKSTPAEALKTTKDYERTPAPGHAEFPAFRYRIEIPGEAEREVLIRVRAPHGTWEDGRSRALRFYDALRRAEEWVQSTDMVEEAVAAEKAKGWPLTRAMNSGIAGLVVNNMLRVYVQRLVGEKAREELAFIEKLGAHIGAPTETEWVDWLFESHASSLSKAQAEQWATLESGPGSLADTATEYFSFHFSTVAAGAIMAATEERETNPNLDWDEAFQRHAETLHEENLQALTWEYIENIAQGTLEKWQPSKRPLEELRRDLLLDLRLDDPAVEGAPALTPLDLERTSLGILSMQPAQTIDRAARGPSGWQLSPDHLPRFTDPRNPLFVEYRRDGATAEALAEGVNRLNPRTADVWRLVTARSLEAWSPGHDSPPSVWVDVREIAAAMGYKKHHKGGYKPEQLAEVARAVHDLDAFHITLPLGTQIYEPAKAGGRRRAPQKLEAVRTHKVLHISARDELRNLFGQRYELRYELKPGDWIKHFPRTYAPLFRALVELPAKAGANTWAKAIGTELAYQYRQNARNSVRVEKLKVRTLLERAVLLEEATANRNKSRMRANFEEALDILKAEEICANWEYEPGDADALEARAGVRGWFDIWLECRVHFTAPERITEELQAASVNGKRAARLNRKLGATR